MKTIVKRLLANALWLGLAATAYPQAPGPDHVTVPLSDPTRPGTVKVSILTGSISVKGYAGKDVIVEAKPRDEDESRSHHRPADTSGMKRIPNLSSNLSVEEEGNVVTVGTGSLNRAVDIALQVPTRTSLRLKTVNDGDIKVEQVQGEIEVNDINGAVTLTQVSGSVVAHALNGNVKVSLAGVEANKPMSFSSLNGDIDVSFPADFKANASMKTDNGEIFSDFDIALNRTAPQPVAEESKGKGGKFKIKIEKTTKGTINGGGPEVQFITMNGNIYIRKASK